MPNPIVNRRIIYPKAKTSASPGNVLQWFNTSMMDISADGLTLQPSGGTFSFMERNPWSETIGTGGVFDVTFTLTHSEMLCGVTGVGNNNNDQMDINFAVQFPVANPDVIYLFENGSLVHFDSGLTLGLPCRIVSDGANVKYYYNSVLIYTSGSIPMGDYKFKCDFVDPGTSNQMVILDY